MRIVRILCAIALLGSSTAAWSQKSYCDKKVCKAWAGPGWYVLYGGYFSKKMIKAGPFQDQETCKVEAANLTKKNPDMVSRPIAGNVQEVVGEFFCLIINSGEKAAEEYMSPS